MPDPIALALIRQFCREGVLGTSDIETIAADLEARGLPEHAHLVRCELLQAAVPSQSDWDAERRRARFEVVPDGGNGAT